MVNLKELEKDLYVLYDPTLSMGQLVLVSKNDNWFGRTLSVSEAYKIATEKNYEIWADGNFKAPYIFAYELNKERNVPTKSSKVIATYCLEKKIIPTKDTVLSTDKVISIAREIMGIQGSTDSSNYYNASSIEVSNDVLNDIRNLK